MLGKNNGIRKMKGRTTIVEGETGRKYMADKILKNLRESSPVYAEDREIHSVSTQIEPEDYVDSYMMNGSSASSGAGSAAPDQPVSPDEQQILAWASQGGTAQQQPVPQTSQSSQPISQTELPTQQSRPVPAPNVPGKPNPTAWLKARVDTKRTTRNSIDFSPIKEPVQEAVSSPNAAEEVSAVSQVAEVQNFAPPVEDSRETQSTSGAWKAHEAEFVSSEVDPESAGAEQYYGFGTKNFGNELFDDGVDDDFENGVFDIQSWKEQPSGGGLPEDSGVFRSPRGVVELLVHKSGRTFKPSYNVDGILSAIESSDGIRFEKTGGGNWTMTDAEGNSLCDESIKSVTFDRQGNVSYKTLSNSFYTFSATNTTPAGM